MKLISLAEAVRLSKFGVDLDVYDLDTEEVNLVHVSVRESHCQEFIHTTSRFTYYVISGKGTFHVEDKSVPVQGGDVLTIPPNTKIWYQGAMELILITTPGWTPEGEVEIRLIPREEISQPLEKHSRDWTLDPDADDQREDE